MRLSYFWGVVFFGEKLMEILHFKVLKGSFFIVALVKVLGLDKTLFLKTERRYKKTFNYKYLRIVVV